MAAPRWIGDNRRRMTHRAHRSYALALLSAVFGWLMYPNPDVWPLVFVCNVPLMLALGDPTLTGRARFLLGWIAGTGLTLGSHHFIAGTLVNLGGLPVAAAIPVFVLYSAYHGIQLGLFAVAYRLLRRFGGRTLWILTVAVVFAALERLHPVWFQAYISNVFWKAPVLAQSLEYLGPSGLTALLIAAQCTMVIAIEERRVAPLGVAVLAWAMLTGWGGWRMQQIEDAAVERRVTVSLIQPNMTVAEKRPAHMPTRMKVWERTLEMTRKARRQRPDLIVWPEGAFPFFYRSDAADTAEQPREPYDRRYSRRLHAFARELDQPFVAAGLRKDDNERVRNGAMFFTPGAAQPVLYDKRALVLLAERVPFGDTWPALVKKLPGASHHVPGEMFRHFDAGGVTWVPSMCYEAVFPGITREALAFDGGGDILLNLTNDVWFGDGSEGPVHLMMQIPRTVENRRWLVRATNSGISAVVDPTGTIRARTDQSDQTTLTFTVPLSALETTFYHRYGDLLLWLAALAGALGTGIIARRDLKRGPAHPEA